MEDHKWITEVLRDIADYAKMNGLPKISEMALDGEILAISEISQAKTDTPRSDLLPREPAILG